MYPTHPSTSQYSSFPPPFFSNPNPLNLFIVSASLTQTSPPHQFSVHPFFCPCVDVICLLWASLHLVQCVPRNISSLNKILRKGTNGRPFCSYLPPGTGQAQSRIQEKWTFSSSTVCFTFQLYCGCFHRQKQCGIMFVEGPRACSSSLWVPRFPLLLQTCKINLCRCDGSPQG